MGPQKQKAKDSWMAYFEALLKVRPLEQLLEVLLPTPKLQKALLLPKQEL